MMTPEERRNWLSEATSYRASLAHDRTEELVSEISRWRKSDPVSTSLHLKKAPAFGWYIEVDSTDPSPSLQRWGLQIGEIANHLRSTLNTTLTRIVREERGRAPRSLQYPIASTGTAWRRALRSDQLKGVPERVVRAIYACQPFILARGAGGKAEDNTLSVLSWLNNTEKHQLEIVGALDASWVNHEALIKTSNGETVRVRPRMAHDWSLTPGSKIVDADSSPHEVHSLQYATLDLQIEVVAPDRFGKITGVEHLLEEIWGAFQQAQLSMIIAWADESIDLELFAGAIDFKQGSSFGQAAVDSLNGAGTWDSDVLRRAQQQE